MYRTGYKIKPKYVMSELDGYDEFNLTNFCTTTKDFDELEACFCNNTFHPSDIIEELRNYIDYVPINMRWYGYDIKHPLKSGTTNASLVWTC